MSLKKILITGENSYIGQSFIEYVKVNDPEKFMVETISVRNTKWEIFNFSKYDVILHLAGIAHASTNPKHESLYYRINRDLTIQIARKAKEEKVRHFIFMSSILVYGDPKDGTITKHTKPNPKNFYGKSKLEAEEALRKIEDSNFKVTILRAPMIYGPNSKGNYQKLSKFAKMTPIFPDYPNKRSMLFIGNLYLFLKVVIENEWNGIFHPQNNEFVKTSEMVKEIAKVFNHKIHTTTIFNPIIKLMTKTDFFNKIFGDLYYEEINQNFNMIDFGETIKLSHFKELK